MKRTVGRLLQRLQELMAAGGWERLEGNQIVIKPATATGGEWANTRQYNASKVSRGFGKLLVGG